MILAWLAEQQAAGRLLGVEVMNLGDISDITDSAFEALLLEIGGAHIMLGGSPCNNLSGLNRLMFGEGGRLNLEGKLSSLFFSYMRLMRVSRGVPLGFRCAV